MLIMAPSHMNSPVIQACLELLMLACLSCNAWNNELPPNCFPRLCGLISAVREMETVCMTGVGTPHFNTSLICSISQVLPPAAP